MPIYSYKLYMSFILQKWLEFIKSLYCFNYVLIFYALCARKIVFSLVYSKIFTLVSDYISLSRMYIKIWNSKVCTRQNKIKQKIFWWMILKGRNVVKAKIFQTWKFFDLFRSICLSFSFCMVSYNCEIH